MSAGYRERPPPGPEYLVRVPALVLRAPAEAVPALPMCWRINGPALPFRACGAGGLERRYPGSRGLPAGGEATLNADSFCSAVPNLSGVGRRRQPDAAGSRLRFGLGAEGGDDAPTACGGSHACRDYLPWRGQERTLGSRGVNGVTSSGPLSVQTVEMYPGVSPGSLALA